MRIAHVPMPLSTADSSVTAVVRHLSRQARLHGDDVFALMSAERDARVDAAENVLVPYSTYCPRQWFTSNEMRLDHTAGLLGLTRPYSARLFLPAIESVRDLSPDVAVLHEGHYATGSLRLWNKVWPGGRIVLYVHTPISRAYRRRELLALLELADHLVFVSDHTRRSVEARIGTFSVPTSVIHNGIDRGVFHDRGRVARGGPLRVTFAGQVSPHKGVHVLLAAAARASMDVALTIVGGARTVEESSAYESSLREAATQSGLAVDFRPRQTPDDLADVFRRSDLVCVPSLWDEPFGMVAVEAMACGAAVIASDRGGLPEACGGAARLIDASNVDEFAGALETYADHAVLEQAQQAALGRATTASWEQVHDELRQVLLSLSA